MCDGRPERPTGAAWATAQAVAAEAMIGPAMVHATHYHTIDVSPIWRHDLTIVGKIGLHVFYTDGRCILEMGCSVRPKNAPEWRIVMKGGDKDFNLKISIRNARLLNAVRAKYGSAANMARQGNLTISRVNSLMTMKLKPVDMHGQWRNIALDVAGMLECDPEVLWPDHIKNVKLGKINGRNGHEI